VQNLINKLVRDRIPELIVAQGKIPVVAQLGTNDTLGMLLLLGEKAVEEAYELQRALQEFISKYEASGVDINPKLLNGEEVEEASVLNELIDYWEVCNAIKYFLGLRGNDLERRALDKNRSHGAFRDGIILLEIQDKPTS
jgi:predicted house-cleaning noncanonical NTP pyrophosphatase (MazG superfamily)